LVASLSLCILFFFSGILFFFAYYANRYRKKVIFQNTRNSVQGKNNKEIRVLAKKFSHNFCDILVEISKSNKNDYETIKGKKVTFNNNEVFDDLYTGYKNVSATLRHFGNWEWVGNRIGLFLSHEGVAV